MSCSQSTKKGFTLVELLIVVAIMGVLAAVGVVVYNGFMGNTKENTVKANHVSIVKFCQSQAMKCVLGANSVVFKDQNGDNYNYDCFAPPLTISTMGGYANACIYHFEGAGWNNIYEPRHLAVSKGTKCSTRTGQTEMDGISYNSIFVCTKWGEGKNDTIINTFSVE